MDIPADIFEIIVCLLADDKQALCSLGLSWKGAIPAIRAHRFRNVRHADGNRSRTPISPVIENAPEICVFIRKLSLFIRSNSTQVYPIIANAVNVQDLTFEWLTTSFYNAENLSSCLAQYSYLTTLTFTNGLVEMSSFFSHLHAIPNLASLAMSSMMIKELKVIASKAWPKEATILRASWDNHAGFQDCTPFEWDTYDFAAAPKPLPNITRLSLTVSNTSDLILLDLISSAKSPFPNVENFTLSDSTGSCQNLRYNALLQNFKTTLTTLELDEPGKCNWIGSFHQSISLTFPPKVRKFTFDVNASSPTTIYDNLSSGNLRFITMRIHVFGHQPGSHKNAARDEALASLNVERFNLEVSIEPEIKDLTKLYEAAERELERNFPLVVAKLRNGSMAGDIIWADKAAHALRG